MLNEAFINVHSGRALSPMGLWFYIFWSFGTVWWIQNFFGNRLAFNPGLGGVRDIVSTIISHEQTQ